MATFKVDTKNKVDIDKKPRVYFTCHPGDFDACFENIIANLFEIFFKIIRMASKPYTRFFVHVLIILWLYVDCRHNVDSLHNMDYCYIISIAIKVS